MFVVKEGQCLHLSLDDDFAIDEEKELEFN
jgi:hypothetical protein